MTFYSLYLNLLLFVFSFFYSYSFLLLLLPYLLQLYVTAVTLNFPFLGSIEYIYLSISLSHDITGYQPHTDYGHILYLVLFLVMCLISAEKQGSRQVLIVQVRHYMKITLSNKYEKMLVLALNKIIY